MSKSNAWETGLLELVFKNTNFALVGDATGLRGSSTAGSLYISLHTADPGETGDQTTSEATYTSYARQGIVRSGSGWTVTNDTVVPAADTPFPASGGTTNVITHYGIGTASSGAGVLLYKGAYSASKSIETGDTPIHKASSSVIEA